MKQRLLILCGVAAPFLFVFMTILGGAIRPGYSHVSHTISELFSPGSPNKCLLDCIHSTYALLTALFGLGVLQFVHRSGQSKPIATLGASMYIAAGFVNLAMATVYPQDPWGSTPTFPGEMHILLAGVGGLLLVISILLLGIWFYRSGISYRFGAYSIITVGAVILSTGFFVAMVSGPIMGLAERIPILLGLVWTFILALLILSEYNSSSRKNS